MDKKNELMKTIAKTDAPDHSQCVERELDEWEKIFRLDERAYGYRIDRYKGKQKIVYIPDTINGRKVGVIHNNAFKEDCALICNKRLWDKLDENLQINSAEAYLKKPELYPTPYDTVVESFIKRNKDLVQVRVLQEDDAAAFERFIQLTVKKLDTKTINSYLSLKDLGLQIKAFLVDRSNPDSTNSNKNDNVDLFFDIENELTTAELKALWTYKKAENGTLILTGYKGNETNVLVPVRIGNTTVTELGEALFSKTRNRYTPEQKRAVQQIQYIVVPEGIVSIGKNFCFGDENLRRIVLPQSLVAIGEDAFRENSWSERAIKNLTLRAPSGSYAERYAKEKGIRFVAV